jgi:2-oxoglutarate dehydrogenase E2 component (dihydrolipoamide succinyltransferase)
MKIDVKVPAVGESITEAVIGKWEKNSGEYVKMNDVILSLETDKASVEVVAEKDGLLTTTVAAGETVQIGATIGNIDTSVAAPAGAASPQAAPAGPAKTPPPSAGATSGRATHPDLQAHLSPAVQRIASENNINTAGLSGTGLGGRLTKDDLLSRPSSPPSQGAPSKSPPVAPVRPPVIQGTKERVPMTTIRKKIAERLVLAQKTAAILTTFNEIDMTKVMEIRAKYKDRFKEKNGVNLGFNGFFVKAVCEALKSFPLVNAWIDGTDVEFHNYYNIGIAVSTERGLMVPVLKNADHLSVAGIELGIRDLANKGRDGKITPDDLSGGTFSITNGGVFGSLLSTPILNPPQSAILGLHKIEDRAVVINGQVVARPMMYVALSYDHRIVDGKEAVSFLVKIKEGVEDPERLLIEV